MRLMVLIFAVIFGLVAGLLVTWAGGGPVVAISAVLLVSSFALAKLGDSTREPLTADDVHTALIGAAVTQVTSPEKPVFGEVEVTDVAIDLAAEQIAQILNDPPKAFVVRKRIEGIRQAGREQAAHVRQKVREQREAQERETMALSEKTDDG